MDGTPAEITPDVGRSGADTGWPIRRSQIIAHKSSGARCVGGGQPPGEDVTLASWLPVNCALTPHGLRHGHKVWMDEDGVAAVLQSERLGHEEPGMRGVYAHVSPVMRSELQAALEGRCLDSLRSRSRLGDRSAVLALDVLLVAARSGLAFPPAIVSRK